MAELVKAFVGDLEVIESGTVHVGLNRNLKLQIGNNMAMEFLFVEDKKKEKGSIKTRIDGKKMIWTLFNFENTIGEGIINPLEVGTFNDRRIYLSFYISTPNKDNENRIINYVIYLGAKING